MKTPSSKHGQKRFSKREDRDRSQSDTYSGSDSEIVNKKESRQKKYLRNLRFKKYSPKYQKDKSAEIKNQISRYRQTSKMFGINQLELNDKGKRIMGIESAEDISRNTIRARNRATTGGTYSSYYITSFFVPHLISFSYLEDILLIFPFE